MTTGGLSRSVMKPVTPITHTESLALVSCSFILVSLSILYQFVVYRCDYKYQYALLRYLDTGNKYTLKTRPLELGLDVREELLNFHSKYYSSNLMTLAVVGKGIIYVSCMYMCHPSVLYIKTV